MSLLCWVSLACFLALQAEGVWAQEKKVLSVQDTLGLRSFPAFSPVGLSPDGKLLVYTLQDNTRKESYKLMKVMDSGVPPSAYGTDVCIANVETGETRNLTGGQGDSWLPTWSPDGEYLAFLSTRGGERNAKLWLWRRRQDDIKQITNLNVGMNQFTDRIQWTPDSKSVVIAVLGPAVSSETSESILSNGVQDRAVVEHGPTAPTVVLYQAAGASQAQGLQKAPVSDHLNLDVFLRDLVVIRVDTGTFRSVVDKRRIASYTVSPDGAFVAYASPKRLEKAGSQQFLFDLTTVSVAENIEHVLAREIRLNFGGTGYSWSPDSSRLAFHTGGAEERNYDCFVVGLQGGSPRNVTTLPALHQAAKFRPSTPLWNHGASEFYFIREGSLWRASSDDRQAVEVSRIPNRRISHLISQSGNVLWTFDGGKSTVVIAHDDAGKRDGFYRIDLKTGDSTKLQEGSQSFTGVFGLENYVVIGEKSQRLAYFAEDAQNDVDLWISDFDFKRPRKLTHHNPQLDEATLGAARLISWLSDDGAPMQGALLLPANYESGKRIPMIVWVYGGESLSNAFNQFGFAGSAPFNMQLLAARGYAVFFPDAPQHAGTPMLDLAKTVLPGVNKVIELGIADSERLGIIGHSYGGYSTLALIVQTPRFKAAVAADGFGDLISAYGQMTKDGAALQVSIAEGGQGLLGGTPWQYRERYIENSPVFYLDRVETPLLIIHGANDQLLPSYLADELFVDLRRLGKTVEYAKYEGEDHSPLYWSTQNRTDFCSRIILWFQKYLPVGTH